ncbi:tRNA-uridine aminocarboxypropyltransferase [Pseudoalteromonas sp. YIC-656]|uniref:tRNA-uridine aminocarboxypropyltransferase n=1 Tax=Pseudoalteromonas pernae TaxID=3118054 RepID=UPI00324231CB
MTRPLCSQCQYPISSCVCRFVQSVNNEINVWILQHPHEASQAKSTTPLLQLALQQAHICVGEVPGDFSQVTALDPLHCAVLYPSQSATPLETMNIADKSVIKHIIVLDGTWSKVHRVWQQNLWLHAIKGISFANVPRSRYRIRKANRENSLSTLEATAYCLQQLEQLDTAPLFKLLDGFVEVQTQHMPEHVKSRYEL